MMKKIRFIPALLFVALLTGCDTYKINVEAPTFSNKGKNIDQETFKTEIIAAYNANEYFKTELDLSSRELQFKETTVEKQNRARNKKVYYTDEHTYLTQGYLKYDSKNVLLDQERYLKETRVTEGDNIDSKANSKNHFKTFLEVGTGDYENKVISLDKMTKELSVYANTTTAEEAKSSVNSAVAHQFVALFNSSKMMHFAEATDAHLYKFYKNGNMFTVIYKESYETTESATIDGEAVAAKKYYVIRETKSQVDLTEGNEAIRISDKTDTACEVLVDHSGYRKGEIVDVETIRYAVCSSVNKEVTLNRIDDYSSYFWKN